MTSVSSKGLHESARLHVTGEASFIDDLAEPAGLLHGALLTSPHPRARILSHSGEAIRQWPGVHTVLFAEDLPVSSARLGSIAHDEPVLAASEVFAVGQVVALVAAESPDLARRAAAALEVSYEVLPALLTVDQAIEKQSFHTKPHIIQRGDVHEAFERSFLRLEGDFVSGGQEHFYLETQVAMVLPLEGGNFQVYSSTQHPSEVQADVARFLGLGRQQVVVQCSRMGGAFGGKESQASNVAVLATLGARFTGRPVKLRLDRPTDMNTTGKRHPWQSRYHAGFAEDGTIIALEVQTWGDGGWSADLSSPILDRCLFHLDSCYYIPSLRFEGRVVKTHRLSNTAFRGFGGPQGMLVIEEVMNQAAARLDMDPAELRSRNYYGPAPRDCTPYGQRVGSRNPLIHRKLIASSNYEERRRNIELNNERGGWTKRGIGYQGVKFGISFTNAFLNQAGALVLIFGDGTVQLNHGGTEMGQGLHSKMIAVCATELGVSPSTIRVMTTSTDKVPNTSPTAASSGSDLNGQAVAHACSKLKERLRPLAAELLGVAPDAPLDFFRGEVRGGGNSLTFASLVQQAWFRRISLAATGYYRTPGIHYDRDRGQGSPFQYFAFGGAVVEVEVNTLTGEHRILRVDILQDVGNSLLPAIDLGQIEGGFVQGCGWLTQEELVWSEEGHLLTLGPSTYKIPAVGDAPRDFRVKLLDRAAQGGVIHGSKAVGEPPFMLAIGVRTALEHAIASVAPKRVTLKAPATPEAILRAIEGIS